MPKLSVIVPVYKVEPYINKCVDSILNQTYKNLEIILVDDGSPDNCGKICDEYAEKDNRVRVIHKENGGLSDARNFALDIVAGEYVSFIDSDDWIEKEMYAETLAYIEKHNLDVICTDVCEVRPNKTFTRHKFDSDKVFTGKEALGMILTDVIDNSVCNKVFKRELWDGIRFPYARRFEDVATTYKVFHKSAKVGYMRKAYYHYFKREGSIIASSFDAQKRYEMFLGYNERWEFAKKHCTEVEEKVKMFAVKAALSCKTALGAGCGTLLPIAQEELDKFFSGIGEVKYLNGKNNVLLWGAKNCGLVNVVYGKLSYWSKRFK